MIFHHSRQRKRLPLFTGILASIFLIVSSFLFYAQGQSRSSGGNGASIVPLFTAAGMDRPGFDDIAPQARRYRRVQINPVVMQPGGIAVGDKLWIVPFEEKAYLATIDRVATDVNGVRSLRGRIDGREGGYFLLSSDRGLALGGLYIPDEHLEFAITYVANRGIQTVQEIDPKSRAVLEDGPPLIPPSSTPVSFLPSPAVHPVTAMAAARIDVMIVYTAAARDWAAGSGGINLVISQAIEKGQLSLDNSDSVTSVRLVYSALVDYTESGDSYTDLVRMTSPSDGYMDAIHLWRDSYGADLVQIFERVEDTGGLGWLLNTTAGLPNYAFTLARVQQAGWTLTAIHEMGHNMGCHHRKDQVTQPGPGLFTYSAGWRWVGSDGNRYCSVMSYEETWGGAAVTRVPYFSNPSISYKGAPTGHAADGDNNRTIREIKQVIAGYRTEAGFNVLTLNTTAGGTTNPSPGSYTHLNGTVVNVTATAETNYEFANWSGDASGTQNPLAVTVDRDKTITANFVRIYTLTLSAGTGGTTSPGPGSYKHRDGTVVSVTAQPVTHYRFLNWSGDASGSTNPLSVTMSADKSVMANFQRIIYPPTSAAGQKVQNRSLSQAEYINVLTWQAHPDNVNITNYKVYLVEGTQKTLLATLSSSDFTYRHRKVVKDKQYTYAIVAVNNEPRDGDPATVVIN